jgi:hypothetical protein
MVLASIVVEDNGVVEDINRKRLREKSRAAPLELVFLMGRERESAGENN